VQRDSYLQLKEKAVVLRKEGKVYSEILATIPVAKSTLSLWLRQVGLAKEQKQRITEKRIAAQKKGAAARRSGRKKTQSDIYAECAKDITSLSDREIFLIGIALYWAEGDKEKEWAPGRSIGFSNTDARMISIFLNWLVRIIKVDPSSIHFAIALHETSKGRISEIQEFWSRETRFPLEMFNTIYRSLNDSSN